jgi:hypothetical protein
MQANAMLVEPEHHDQGSDAKTELLDQNKAISTLDELYEHHSLESHWFRASGHDDRLLAMAEAEKAGSSAQLKEKTDNAGIYGEILPNAVANFLKQYTTKGQKYYDLGAGHGKTVALAYLLGLDATGVEIGSQRWENSCAALKRMEPKKDTVEHGPGMRFIHGSFLETDFSDADLMFVDNLEYPDELTAGIAKNAAKMRPGTKIISAKEFQGPAFKKIGLVPGASSWDNDSVWLLHEVVGDPQASLVQKDVNTQGSQSKAGPDVCAI